MTTLTVGKILNELMGDMSEAEFASLVNVPKATINRLLSGKTPDPRIGTLTPIAQYFGITIEQLLGLTPLPNNLPLKTTNPNKFYTLPFIEFDKIYLYFLGKYLPEKYHNISTTHEYLLDKNSYVTNVIAASMMPKFQENSYLIINTNLEPKNNDFVIYYDTNKKSILFRKLIIENKDQYLCAIYPGFDAIKLDKNFISLGIVVESRIFLR